MLNNEYALAFVEELGKKPTKKQLFQPLKEVMTADKVSFELAAKSLVSQAAIHRNRYPHPNGSRDGIINQFDPVQVNLAWQLNRKDYILLWDALERVVRNSEFSECFPQRSADDLQCQKQAIRSIGSNIIRSLDEGLGISKASKVKRKDVETGDLFTFQVGGKTFIAQCFRDSLYAIWNSSVDDFPNVLGKPPIIAVSLLSDSLECMDFVANYSEHPDPNDFYYQDADIKNKKLYKVNVNTFEKQECSYEEFKQLMDIRPWSVERIYKFLLALSNGERYVELDDLELSPESYTRPDGYD